MNKVILYGNVATEPKSIKGDRAVIRLATQETADFTNFHSVFAGKDTAKVLMKVRKGERLLVEGSIRYYDIVDENGDKRQSASIEAWRIEFGGGKRRDDDAEDDERPAKTNRKPRNDEDDERPAKQNRKPRNDDPDDDIPF